MLNARLQRIANPRLAVNDLQSPRQELTGPARLCKTARPQFVMSNPMRDPLKPKNLT
jgi:hypothetical protein